MGVEGRKDNLKTDAFPHLVKTTLQPPLPPPPLFRNVCPLPFYQNPP
jgi:hypothetical protein